MSKRVRTDEIVEDDGPVTPDALTASLHAVPVDENGFITVPEYPAPPEATHVVAQQDLDAHADRGIQHCPHCGQLTQVWHEDECSSNPANYVHEDTDA